MKACPNDWHPACSCSIDALEPDEQCDIHGYPDHRRCPYCGQIRGHKACKRCGCTYGLPKEEPMVVFKAVPAPRCDIHQNYDEFPKGSMVFSSCPCGLADSGHYMITWHGAGLGLVCISKEDGDRKAHMMNVAWNLACGLSIDAIILKDLT